MNNDFMLYGVIDKSTGKLVSDITNPRHKYWDKKGSAEKAISNYGAYYHNNNHKPEDLELVEIECKVKDGGENE